jgi:flagellar biosynthetic protein FliR
MPLESQLYWPLTVLVVSLRVGAVVLMTPVFNFINLPVRIRVLLVLALSAVLVTGLDLKLPAAALQSPAGLAAAAAGELAIGSVLAFALFATFAAFQLGGRILDVQLGFGVAGLIDPATNVAAPLLGMLLNLAAVITFFQIGGHELLMRGLAFSLTQLRPGGTSLHAMSLPAVVAQFGAMFVSAAAIAAPVMVVVLLVDVAMAMMARMMPQMNILFVGLPLKILVGLMVLAFTLDFFGPLYSSIFAQLFSAWQAMLPP